MKGTRARGVSAFERASALWQQTLRTLTTSGPDLAEIEIRRQFASARDLDAVEAVLGELEAHR